MAVSRKDRRARHRERVAQSFGEGGIDAALDALELMELAWHDCYGESSPPQTVVDDVLIVSQGDLSRLVSAALLGVIDRRDLRLAADSIRD